MHLNLIVDSISRKETFKKLIYSITNPASALIALILLRRTENNLFTSLKSHSDPATNDPDLNFNYKNVRS